MTFDSPRGIVRPTFRCLLVDLGHEVDPPHLRRALRASPSGLGTDPTKLLPCPLFDVEHLLIEKANLIASGPAASHERIQAIRDQIVLKVKASARRGALWQDASGIWWLLAAGRRKDDGADDFYRVLQRYTARGSKAIMPTPADDRYLLLERAFAAELHLEDSARTAIQTALACAAASPDRTFMAELFGASVSIRISFDERDLAVLELAWELRSFREQDRFPHEVLGLIPGLESLDCWDVIPGVGRREPETWYSYVEQGWVDRVKVAAALSNPDDSPE